MSDNEMLKPCPFCGEPPAVEMTGFHLNGRTIYCAGNDCMGPSTTAASFDDAARQWNTRAAAASPIADLVAAAGEYRPSSAEEIAAAEEAFRVAAASAEPEIDMSQAELVLGEAYQVVGTLLSDTGQFDTERGQKILDNLSQGKMVHSDILPWPSAEKAASAEPVAWRYQSKEGWEGIWRVTNVDPASPGFFEAPGNWNVEPLYTHPAPDAEIGAALEAGRAIVKVWQDAPPGVSFGSFMERALRTLDAALAKAKGVRGNE